jgi:hypothetical protein
MQSWYENDELHTVISRKPGRVITSDDPSLGREFLGHEGSHGEDLVIEVRG